MQPGACIEKRVFLKDSVYDIELQRLQGLQHLECAGKGALIGRLV